jgi:hypothetical protein
MYLAESPFPPQSTSPRHLVILQAPRRVTLPARERLCELLHRFQVPREGSFSFFCITHEHLQRFCKRLAPFFHSVSPGRLEFSALCGGAPLLEPAQRASSGSRARRESRRPGRQLLEKWLAPFSGKVVGTFFQNDLWSIGRCRNPG